MSEDSSSQELEDSLDSHPIPAAVLNQASDLEIKHILSTYADVCAKIKEHEILHTVHYVVAFKKVMEKNIEDVMKKNHKVYFEHKDYPYSGIPFIFSSSSILDCQHGKDKGCVAKFKYREKKNQEATTDHSCFKKRVALQDTKKFDCPAKVSIKEIVEFPEFKLERDTSYLRRETSKKLHSALATQNKFITIKKYILLLPGISVHKNHLINDAAGLNQPLSKDIVKKIVELVKNGVNSVPEMKRHLSDFVNVEFNSKIIPEKSNKRFFPRDETIANHIKKARLNLRRSMIDQECLRDKINEWKLYFPDAKIMFRPKGECNSESNVLYLKDSFLFVYQDAWQQRLLSRYGNELAFLDATYRTTRYALPLFFIVVKTNVDYQIVAIFVCENETTDAITEALMCIKEWNPSFQPTYFFTDYSNEEINSLESVFPGCQVHICDFHREQAWERWLSKSVNGCCLVKDRVKEKLHAIAYAKTKEICQKEVHELEESHEWKSNPKLSEYLKNTWLCIQKRWVFAYRQDRLLLNVNTNNGIERQNQSFKYSFLEKRKNSSITSMLTICIEEFLSHKYDSYCDKNRMAHTSYKKYNKNIPEYLIDRPKPLVKHCIRLIDKLQGVNLQGITSLTERLYNVASFNSNSREIYQCYLGDAVNLPTCSCPSWFNSAYPCKHFFGIFLKENLSWSAFGTSYANSPYFTLDLFTEENALAASAQEFTHSSNILLQNNLLTHATPLQDLAMESSVQIDSSVQFMKDNNALGYTELNSEVQINHHTSEKCRELLNEIRQLTYLCSCQKAVDNLFDGLYQLKTNLVNSLPAEQGILLRPENMPDIWHKSQSNLPRLCELPLRRKRKMPKRVGKKYDLHKAASRLSFIDKNEFCISEVITSHSIGEDCEIFTVLNDLTVSSPIQIEEIAINHTNEMLKEECDATNDHHSAFQHIKYLKSSLIGNKEQHDISKEQMLNDKVIHFCQQLMSIQLNIDVGLQDPIKGQVLSFHIYPSTPFVQILHDGNLHWLCVTTYDCKPGEIYIFDSLFHGSISLHTKRQICYLLHCQEKNLTFKVLPIQQQTNGVDCGIYAIAWARQILETKSIPSTYLTFEQSEMRSHLLKCILNNRLEIFPVTKNPSSFRKCAAKTIRIPLHCSCRMFWVPGDEDIFNRQMAQCYACRKWFHRDCEKIPLSAYEKEDEIWICCDCQSQLKE
ncbi:uncharacterized protein LOC136080567 [Hydra vulgaris]|uniref:Uncharacterized protein LOC136080567 n=1 Tax=Hydra vulgaris TaxID=6087 RepID=A0ABM4BW69_HYDVU